MSKSRLATLWAGVVVASLLLGLLFDHLGVPAAWILAGIVASATAALATSKELRINQGFFSVCRGFIGVLAGLPLLQTTPAAVAQYILPGLFVTAITLGIGVGGGMLLARSQPAISRETGVLSMLAGGASVLPLLAKELGADYRYVALSQYLRLLTVSVSLPLVTHLLIADTVVAPVDLGERPWWIVVLVVAIAVFGEHLGRLLRLPVPSVFGPLVLVVLAGIALPGFDLTPPEPVQYLAFMAIGWLCGGSLSVPALKAFAKQLPATILFIVVLIGGCAASALPLCSWLGISYFEAYLATTPGALETVLALSAEGGAGAVVVTIQIIRLLFVLLAASYLPRLLRR